MSLGSMFSSPGKQAGQAASGQEAAMTGVINELQAYNDQHQQQLRSAIAQQGENPYFSAAQQLNPQAYYTQPGNGPQFSAGGPGSGLTPGASGNTPVSGPPALPLTILQQPPAQNPPPVTQPQPQPPTTTPPDPTPHPQPPGPIPRRQPEGPIPMPPVSGPINGIPPRGRQ